MHSSQKVWFVRSSMVLATHGAARRAQSTITTGEARANSVATLPSCHTHQHHPSLWCTRSYHREESSRVALSLPPPRGLCLAEATGAGKGRSGARTAAGGKDTTAAQGTTQGSDPFFPDSSPAPGSHRNQKVKNAFIFLKCC